jgi:hypothetical protein
MLRSRVMRPGLVTNEVLAELGPLAEILFTRLWMLADREGRLEDRPKRIKAEALPYYDADVENLLEKLSESGFILRYAVLGQRYIGVVNWKKHQPIHAHEAASVIPAPLAKRSKRATKQSDKNVRNVSTCTGAAGTCPGSSFSFLNTYKLRDGVVEPEEAPPPPPSAENPISEPTTPPAVVPRKPPGRELVDQHGERPPRPAPVIDWWPHKPEDVSLVRESLNALAKEVGMPPADDQIVRQVLDLGRGADGQRIHETLVMLFHKHKFRSMHSWGLLPVVIAQCFRAAS